MAACVIPRTKTLAPQRQEIPDLLQPLLRAWWKQHGEPRSGPVFSVTKGKRKGEARRTRGVSFADRLRRALLTAGIDRHELHHETATSLPVDFHSGRRAFRTALERAGVDTQTAMLLGGWEDPRAAARYVVMEETLKIPAAALPSAAVAHELALPNPTGAARMDGERTPSLAYFRDYRSGTRGSNSRPSAWEAEVGWYGGEICRDLGDVGAGLDGRITGDHEGAFGNGRRRPFGLALPCPGDPEGAAAALRLGVVASALEGAWGTLDAFTLAGLEEAP